MEAFIKENQQEIVRTLEALDGNRFVVDKWDRPHGGGGISCVLQEGNVFEKAGVNTSVVYGTLPRQAISKMRANHKALDPDVGSLEFFAAGLSLVLHPHNPMAPTVHLNYRYFETANADGTTNAWWFGGGTDLTPNYLFDEDVIHFHRNIKEACDAHDKDYYSRFKKWCDEYFYVKPGANHAAWAGSSSTISTRRRRTRRACSRSCSRVWVPSCPRTCPSSRSARICHGRSEKSSGSSCDGAAMSNSTWCMIGGRLLA